MLFTFPSRYWFTIGRSRCLALEGGPPGFPQGSSCLVVLRIPVPRPALPTTGFSPSLTVPSNTFVFAPGLASLVLQPQSLPCGTGWFGLFPLRSPLLRESHLISSRRATEMFQFTRCPPSLPMCSAGGLQTSLWRGCPIRNLRALRLHAAPPERFAGLRVLLRPSAPRHPPRTLSSLFASCRFLHLALRWGCSLASFFALLCLEFVRVDVLCFSLARSRQN